jgi:hypothetical protein
MPKFEKDSQLTLGGATQSEEEWVQAVSKVEDVPTRCPFCLKSQNLREMLFANRDGSLSKMRKCRWCQRKMQAVNAVVFLRGEEAYAQFVATYPMWWRVIDHDEFMAALEHLKELGVFEPWVFWVAYRKIKPRKGEEFASNANEVRELMKPTPPKPPTPPDTSRLFAFKHRAGELPTSYVRGEKVETVEGKLVVLDGGKPVQRFGAAAWELVDSPDMPERAT